MPRLRGLPWGLVIAVVIGAATAVSGRAVAVAGVSDGGPIAIVAVEISGDAAPELRDQVEMALQRGLERAGRNVVSLAGVQSATVGQRDLAGCLSTACLARIGDATGTDRFITVRVDGSGASYEIEIALLRADVAGAVDARRRGTCAVCTVTELEDKVAELAGAAVSAAAVRTRPVEIDSVPAGATIRVGEDLTGPAPLRGELAPGDHRVEATLPGHATATQTITVGADATETQRFSIALDGAGGGSKPIPPAEPHRFGWLRWAAIGTGVASLAAGVTLLALDGEGTCGRDAPAECPELYTTSSLGIGALILGVGLGGLGTWMIVHDRRVDREHAARSAAITPIRGGAIASFAMSF